MGEKVKFYLNNGKTVVGTIVDSTSDSFVVDTSSGTVLVLKSEVVKRTKLIAKIVRVKDPSNPARVEHRLVEREDPFAKLEVPKRKPVSLKTVPAPGKVKAPAHPAKNARKKPPRRRTQRPKPAPGTAAPGARASPNPDVLYQGRLVDKYSWLSEIRISTLLSILFALWVIFWYGIDFFARILDFEDRSTARSMSAATIWVVLVILVTLIPNPTHLIAIGVMIGLLVAAILTARKVLEANWVQTIEAIFLGGFGLFLVFLLVEVGQAIIEL